MSKITAYGHYDGARLRAEAFAAAVKSYPIGTMLKFTVCKYVPEKTQPQLGYLHVLFSIAARALNKDAMGSGEQWTPSMVKELAKRERLYPVIDRVLPSGEVVQIVLDTRNLNREQTAETIDRVIHYFAELGIVLPEPREQQSIRFEK